jgi:nicotinamidase-related amidase
MAIETRGPDISTSALIIVDMQNDFVHEDGGFAQRARAYPERGWDIPFVMSAVPPTRRLLDALPQPTSRTMRTRSGRIGVRA